MTTTELDSQVSSGCSPDGACAVVDDHAGARIGQPAMVVPGAMEALQAVGAAIAGSGLPERTVDLVNLRVSQINGCGVCLFGDVHIAKKHGESDDRLAVVAGWREAPFFSSNPSSGSGKVSPECHHEAALPGEPATRVLIVATGRVPSSG